MAAFQRREVFAERMPLNTASEQSPVGWRSRSGAPQRRAEGLFLQTHTVSLPKCPPAGALERGRSVGRCHLRAIPAPPGWVTLSWWLALRPHFPISQMGLCWAGRMSVGMVFVPVRGASISGGEALSRRPGGLSNLQGALPTAKGEAGSVGRELGGRTRLRRVVWRARSS